MVFLKEKNILNACDVPQLFNIATKWYSLRNRILIMFSMTNHNLGSIVVLHDAHEFSRSFRNKGIISPYPVTTICPLYEMNSYKVIVLEPNQLLLKLLDNWQCKGKSSLINRPHSLSLIYGSTYCSDITTKILNTSQILL